MNSITNPGSMEFFTSERELSIDSAEATALYTGALKQYRDHLLSGGPVLEAEQIQEAA